jgi:4'-phosphopantetheinyl transferase
MKFTNQTEVWQIDLAQDVDLAQAMALLDHTEVQRAKRFIDSMHTRRFIVAHAALRQILGWRMGCDPAAIEFKLSAHGRPLLPDGGPVFSLSHSGDMALVAVAAEGELGVDIECRRTLQHRELARRFFSESEADAIDALAGYEREAAFFDCWVRKEAYIKAKGLGLALPLDSFALSVPAQLGQGLLFSHRFPEDVARYQLRLLQAPAGYHAALASTANDAAETIYRYWPAGAATPEMEIEAPD